jgi:DNA primase
MSTIDDVKQRLDIVQLVSEYTKLQKSGRNYKALCPFHAEKNPSFFVFPERQSWHCFGQCGTGGDIFSFIMRKNGLDFAQALTLLAEKAGVELVTKATAEREAENKEREKLFEINKTAAAYYHDVLLNTPDGRAARDYATRRGLSPDTIKDFQLGFSTEGWDTLKQHLKLHGYDEADLLLAGLLVERDDTSSYDRFRNRLIFPIRNLEGKIVGFGGRALDDSLPKYLNSPQTPIFDKGRTLYGIDRAKRAIISKKQAIIVEGYMDVITAHQHGYDNVVASMGTSVTDRQLGILKGLTTNLMFALDADAAGQEAMARSGEMVDKILPVPQSFYGWVKYEDAHKAEVKILLLPAGKDPDDLIKSDPAQWQKLLADAKPIVDFIFESTAAKFDLGGAKGKSLAMERILPLLLQMRDPLRQAHYIERLARLLKVDQHVIADILKKIRANERKRLGKNVRVIESAIPAFASSSSLEQYCLALLLRYPQLKAKSQELLPDHFANTENRELFTKWQQNDNLDTLKNGLDIGLKEHLESLTAKKLPPLLQESEAARREDLNRCIARLQEMRLKTLETRKQELLAMEAETGGTEAQLTRLEEQGLEVSKKLKEIFTRQDRRQRLSGRNT